MANRAWHLELVRRRASAMHVDTICSHQKAADGTVREYRSYLLRHSFRDEQGRPRKETLANLTALPEAALEAVRKALRGETVVSADEAFEVERSVPHGDAAAAHVMASQLGLRALLGPACAERDIAYALILSRAVRPRPKLPTARWWQDGDTPLGRDLGLAGSRCSTCPPPGWKARTASWRRSGIPATASAAASRSSMGCSPTRRAARSPAGCSPATPPTRSRSRPRSPGSAKISASSA